MLHRAHSMAPVMMDEAEAINEDNMLLENLTSSTKLQKSHSVYAREERLDFLEVDKRMNSQCFDNENSLRELVLYLKNDIESALNVFFVLGTKKEKFEALADMLNYNTEEILKKISELMAIEIDKQSQFLEDKYRDKSSYSKGQFYENSYRHKPQQFRSNDNREMRLFQRSDFQRDRNEFSRERKELSRERSY